MNNTVLAGLIVGAVVVSAAGAIAFNSGFNPLQKYAKVVAVEPAFETNRVPRQACGEEAELARAATLAETPDDQPAPDATASAKAGDRKPADGETDCVTVYDTESIQAGYDVTYELDGVQKVVRMDHDPGERIPVEDGELVLSRS